MVVERLGALDEAPSWATNPMSPAKRESYRMEMQRKADNATRNLGPRLAMYQTRQARSASLAPVLNESNRFKDTRVMAMMNLDGNLPTLVSQRPDRAVANINTLRFIRDVPHGMQMPGDGGPLYGSTTLEGNWVEEKRDRAHHSEWHVKELRRNKLWDTEHTSNYVMHSPQYADKILRTHIVANAAPSIDLPALPGTDSSDALVHYASDGFGEGVHQDHTNATKKGGHWVGTAPVRDGKESITTTAHGHREYLEFQMRTGTSDPLASFLGTMPAGGTRRVMDKWTAKAHEDLRKSQLHTSAWGTTYVRDFRDFSKGPVPRASVSAHGFRGGVTSLVQQQRPHTAAVQ